MSSHLHMHQLSWPEQECSRRPGNPADRNAVRPRLTRVHVEALVSGDFVPLRLGPELVHRLNHAWSGAGQRLHMLRIEVVHNPLKCPRCGDSALYRKERRGLLQKKLYPLLGLFPWRCASCRKSSLLRQRSVDHGKAAVLPLDDFDRQRSVA